MEPQGKKPTNTELLVRGIKRMAAEAREDVTKFFEFVIREETSKKPLVPTPHQILFFSFAMHHQRGIIRQPISTGKTYGIATIALYLLGRDCTQRGLVISKSERLAKKPLKMVSDYITEPSLNSRLALVFPNLQESRRVADTWSTEKITVDRPAAIRDASLLAAGVESQIDGSRLSFIFPDDMVSIDNSRSPEARADLESKFDGIIMNRLDPRGGRVIMTNTPWDRKDLTFRLESIGWPTLVMDIYGYIRVANADAAWMRHALDHLLRPSTTRVGGRYDWYRLRAHDPDPDEATPLFPDRFSAEQIAEIRASKLPNEFARTFLCEPLSEEASRCQQDWIERCKLAGIGTSLSSRYTGPNPTYTGVDIGIGHGKQHDRTALVTIERRPDGKKRLLDIESGRWTGPEILSRVYSKHANYKSVLQVEGNQGQKFIKDFAEEQKKDLPIKAVSTTSVNKHHVEYGVESIFREFQNGEWIIPCDEHGRCHPEVQALLDEMLYYDPTTHTGDRLMALWMAREASRKNYRNHPRPRAGLRREMPYAGGF